VLVPRPSSSRAPAAKPITVPPSARSAVDPVDAALLRSTAKVPRTTQSPCWTPVRSATRTAAASASDPRRLFWNQTERKLACPAMTRMAPDSAAARRPAVVSCAWAPYQPRRRAAMVSVLARLVAISASPDHGTDGGGDRRGVNGAARGDFHQVIVARVQRPVARDTGLLPPLHLADIGQRRGPVLAGQQVSGLPEHRGDRGEQLAVARRRAV